jgi:hypothetical protein
MSLSKKFLDFHEKNPQVYDLFKRYAFQLIEAGVRHTSVALIIERIRWESAISTTDQQYTVSNNFRADYARLFMQEHPQFRDFFTVKKRTAAEFQIQQAA